MTDSKLLDSSAWLSYVYAENLEIRNVVESEDFLFTSVLSLFEIKLKLLKDKKDVSLVQKSLEFIRKRSLVLPVNEEISEDAAEFSLKHKLSAMDALIYTSSLKQQAILVTLDNDFRGLKNVEILK